MNMNCRDCRALGSPVEPPDVVAARRARWEREQKSQDPVTSPAGAGAWIETGAELPPIGERVRVRGAYTPEGYGYPVAYRREDRSARGGWRWESTQWRGTAGVTGWQRIERA